MNIGGIGAMAGGLAQGYTNERQFQQRQAANKLLAQLIGSRNPTLAKAMDPTYDPAKAAGAPAGAAPTYDDSGGPKESGEISGMGQPASGPGPLASDAERGMAANDNGGKPNGPVVGGPSDQPPVGEAAPAGAAPPDNPSNSNPGAPIPATSVGNGVLGGNTTAASPGTDDVEDNIDPGNGGAPAGVGAIGLSQLSSKKAKRGPVVEQPHKPPTGTRGTGLDQADIDAPAPPQPTKPTRANPMAKGLTPSVPTYQNYDPPNLGAPNASL